MARRICSALRERAIFNFDICPMKLLSSQILFKGSIIVKWLLMLLQENKTLLINETLKEKLSLLTLI